MQFVYLRTCVPLQSVFQIKHFLQLQVLFSVGINKKKREKKLSVKKLNVDRQFFKNVICIFDVALCHLIAGGRDSTYSQEKSPPILSISMNISIYSTYLFLLEPPSLFSFCQNPLPCPPDPFLINKIFSWKSKLKHTDIDIVCFFSGSKIFNNET